MTPLSIFCPHDFFYTPRQQQTWRQVTRQIARRKFTGVYIMVSFFHEENKNTQILDLHLRTKSFYVEL